MSILKKLPNFTKFPNKLSGNGRNMVKSNILLPKVVIDDINCPEKMMKINLKDDLSSMPEFLPENNKMISKDKFNFFEKDIQTTKLSQILEVESTTKGKVLKPFWNCYSQEISKKLWLPLMTDLVDLDPNYSNGCSIISDPNLSLSKTNHIEQIQKNSQTTLWKLSQCSVLDTMEPEIKNSRKIRIYPNKPQRKLFEQMFGATRYFHNKTIDFMEYYNMDNDYIKVPKLPTARSYVLNNDKDLNDDHHEIWTKQIPYDTRQLAIDNCLTMHKSAEANKRNKNIKHYDMHYLVKKNKGAFAFVNKNALTKNLEIFKKRLKKHSKLKFTNRMERWVKRNMNKFQSNFPICRDISGRYYIHMIYEEKPKKIKGREEIVALDPGVRTFQTFYSENSIGECGKNIMKKIYPLQKKIDHLQSIKKEQKSKTRHNMERRCNLLRTKIKNIISDLHWQTASFLTRNYNTILLPHLKTRQIVQNGGKKLHRDMYCLSHYKFIERIKHKANMNNCEVIICNEHHTSKTCTNCGKLNYNLGSSKTFDCDACKIKIDRDVNGARNVLIRSLTKYFDNYRVGLDPSGCNQ